MHVRALAQRERILVIILLSVSLLSVLSVSTVVHPVKGAGLLYISPQPFIDNQPKGTIITYQVKVANIGPFNAWDISVSSDPTVILPQSLDITGNLLVANYSVPAGQIVELTNCVNGMGTFCSPTDQPGVLHSQIALLAPPPQMGPSSGLLFTITFKVVAGYASNVQLFNDVIVDGNTATNVPHTDLNGRYGSKLPPVAEFTWSPKNPFAGDSVTFNASLSHDPNLGASIVSYAWYFDDTSLPAPPSNNQTIVHQFVAAGVNLTGNFQVKLTVVDSLGITNSNTTTVTVVVKHIHDLAISGISLNHDDDNIAAGTVIRISVTVANYGTFDEGGWNMTVRINGQLQGKPYQSAGNLTSKKTIIVSYDWDTSGLKPDSYEILATVSPVVNETQYEPSLANNQFTHWVRIISPIGGTLITLSLLTTVGLVPVVLILISLPIALFRRAQRSNKQLAEDAL